MNTRGLGLELAFGTIQILVSYGKVLLAAGTRAWVPVMLCGIAGGGDVLASQGRALCPLGFVGWLERL